MGTFKTVIWIVAGLATTVAAIMGIVTSAEIRKHLESGTLVKLF